MIIVSGKLHIVPGRRDAFVARSVPSVIAAREAPGCIDFAVSVDPVEPARVNIYEEWESMDAIEASRGSGPEDDLFSLIARADVKERSV